MKGYKNLDKHIPKRTYRERSQPEERTHLGFLEKHKDYKIRTTHAHKQADMIADLKEKAYERNPDEFYHAMIKNKQENGIHFWEEDEIDPKVKAIIKTKDLQLVTMKQQITQNKIDKLQATLAGSGTGKHIKFKYRDESQNKIDEEYEQNEMNQEPLIIKKQKIQKTQIEAVEVDEEQLKQLNEKKLKKLQDLKEKNKLFKEAMLRLAYQKQLLKKEKAKEIEPGVYKWFRQRCK